MKLRLFLVFSVSTVFLLEAADAAGMCLALCILYVCTLRALYLFCIYSILLVNFCMLFCFLCPSAILHLFILHLSIYLSLSTCILYQLEFYTPTVSANIVVVPEDHHTGLGHTLLLPCVAFASSNDTAAAVSIGWRHSGESFDANPLLRVHTSQVMMLQGGLTVHKSVLEICVTEVDVSAEYSCVVVNGQDIIEQATFRITVEGSHDNNYYDAEHEKIQSVAMRQAEGGGEVRRCVAVWL